ncbi:MAG: hypothetical protein CO096_05035 [Armatimonadetes bacterium CG_4_9_14_3_um_filter_66_14]|nr:MAG: hypothetical protein CO096_05035 [Armatimonadetes bacterium CG_4_9_14_3_um_filter_66_14]
MGQLVPATTPEPRAHRLRQVAVPEASVHEALPNVDTVGELRVEPPVVGRRLQIHWRDPVETIGSGL